MKKSFTCFIPTFAILLLLVFSPFILQGQDAVKKTEVKAEKSEEKTIGEFVSIKEASPAPEKYKAGLEAIMEKNLKSHVTFLSSDLLEGRDTASRGYDIAAEYIASLFTQWGVKPAGDLPPAPPRGRRFEAAPKKEETPKERTFFQEIAMKETVSSRSAMKVETRKDGQVLTRIYSPDADYNFFPRASETVSAPIVFLGYGITEEDAKYDDLKGLDLTGKIVMVIDGLPGANNPASPFNDKKYQDKYPTGRSNRFRPSPKSKLLQDKGVAMILTVTRATSESDVPTDKLRRTILDDSRPIMPDIHRRIRLTELPNLKMPWDATPSIQISRETAKNILNAVGYNLDDIQGKIDSQIKPNSFVLPGTTLTLESVVEEKLARCRNVIGMVEGSDPKLKDECVVIGAHLDHLGRNGDYIYNGADDNASGSAGVMEIARAFALNPVKPKRSIIFALWTGEEKGLLGSMHYVQHPFTPLKNIAAYINLDMISHPYKKEDVQSLSRYLKVTIPEEKINSLDMNIFLPVTFSRTYEKQTADIFRDINRYLGMELFIISTAQPGGGSDHASFAMFRIPVISFHTTDTADYHQPTDSLDKIDSKMMERVSRVIWLTAFQAADTIFTPAPPAGK